MHGGRLFLYDCCCFSQFLGGLELTVRMNDCGAPFAFRLGLFGHGALHLLGQVNIPYFHKDHFDTPRFGLSVENFLDSSIHLFPLCEQLVQLGLAADASERDLGELGGGKEVIRDFADRAVRIEHSEIEHGAYFHGNVVSCDYVLRRHVQRDSPEINTNHRFDEWDHISDSGTARGRHPAETKNYGPLVFSENFDPADDQNGDYDDNRRYWSDKPHNWI